MAIVRRPLNLVNARGGKHKMSDDTNKVSNKKSPARFEFPAGYNMQQTVQTLNKIKMGEIAVEVATAEQFRQRIALLSKK